MIDLLIPKTASAPRFGNTVCGGNKSTFEEKLSPQLQEKNVVGAKPFGPKTIVLFEILEREHC